MTTPLPRISIVTPSYNQAAFIGWTVRSVLLQRYPNLEYIMMDGGSDDGTVEALAPYRDEFAHYQSAPDEGQSAAIHDGFEHASGDIMAWLNSDDLLAPGALHYVADYFARNPRVDMLYSHRCMIDEANRVIGYWILPPHRTGLMKRWDLIPQETCFWRRSLFERCGNADPTYQFAVDYDLFARYMRVATVRRVNRFLGAFRIHDLSKTTQALHTVGFEEIKRVQEDHDIRFTRYHVFRGPLFRRRVQFRGRWHAMRQHILPGARGGVGYDYDDVWGGLLNGDTECPPLTTPANPPPPLQEAAARS
jgi:glycosyltransferase involved in cell wall biosynthesis